MQIKKVVKKTIFVFMLASSLLPCFLGFLNKSSQLTTQSSDSLLQPSNLRKLPDGCKYNWLLLQSTKRTTRVLISRLANQGWYLEECCKEPDYGEVNWLCLNLVSCMHWVKRVILFILEGCFIAELLTNEWLYWEANWQKACYARVKFLG